MAFRLAAGIRCSDVMRSFRHLIPAAEKTMSRVLPASCLLFAVAGFVSGCATAPQTTQAPRTLLAPRGVIFVADGAGGGDATTRAFRRALEDEGVPLAVEGLN